MHKKNCREEEKAHKTARTFPITQYISSWHGIFNVLKEEMFYSLSTESLLIALTDRFPKRSMFAVNSVFIVGMRFCSYVVSHGRECGQHEDVGARHLILSNQNIERRRIGQSERQPNMPSWTGSPIQGNVIG